MLTENDLKIINEALSKGKDVTIKPFPNGDYRIYTQEVKLLKKTEHIR